ncbi:alpha/beta fold hydrolase [Pedococcus sp. 2YAF34]|uniref:alpha/beta fold hydrolase n=1 Tax=Pedococcus sp. 2YAF34 TaxID=3233032 RepID=UPI003F971609
MTTTHSLQTPDGTLAYDVHGPLPTADGRPPLFMVGAPMGADGFSALVALVPDRTVVTYDVRGLGRSVRTDGSDRHTPEQNADDQHRIIEALGAGPVEVFASSGGAVSALALVAAHPADVTVLVAHEPPCLAVLPDAEAAFAAERAVHATYASRGWAAGMAHFIAMTSVQGELTDEFATAPAPDPAMFGMPTQDDGTRSDPLLSGVSDAITAFRPDVDALQSAPARIVLAAGIESKGTLTWRTTEAVAALLGTGVEVFPSHHGGFVGGEGGYAGQPGAFAARLREVLDADR